LYFITLDALAAKLWFKELWFACLIREHASDGLGVGIYLAELFCKECLQLQFDVNMPNIELYAYNLIVCHLSLTFFAYFPWRL
jgi:hypothetical protein